MDQNQQMRFTENELALIKSTFKGNTELLKLLRKVFLPYYDPKSPYGQVIDLWMTLDLRQLTPEQAYTRLLARNELIMHVEQQLIQLSFLAEDKSDKEKEEDQKKNSAK